MISEGFGSSNTIRGLRENRILAEGMAWANTELRIKLVKFKLANQYFYIAMNQNFIVSADFAKCFTEGMDAGLWIGIGINYQL